MRKKYRYQPSIEAGRASGLAFLQHGTDGGFAAFAVAVDQRVLEDIVGGSGDLGVAEAARFLAEHAPPHTGGVRAKAGPEKCGRLLRVRQFVVEMSSNRRKRARSRMPGWLVAAMTRL